MMSSPIVNLYGLSASIRHNSISTIIILSIVLTIKGIYTKITKFHHTNRLANRLSRIGPIRTISRLSLCVAIAIILRNIFHFL